MCSSAEKINLYVVIPAAGSGTRMGSGINKLFISIGSETVIERTLRIFENFGEKTESKSASSPAIEVTCVVVTNESSLGLLREIVDRNSFRTVKSIILGGDTRTASVYNGIRALAELPTPPKDSDIVFIHDGARCMVSSEVLHNCLRCMSTSDVCVAGVPAKNTIKIVENHKVTSTPDRRSLYEVQTPQAFRYHVLREAYEYAHEHNILATDDTALTELIGYGTVIAEGSYSNIKITTPEDILFAQALASRTAD